MAEDGPKPEQLDLSEKEKRRMIGAIMWVIHNKYVDDGRVFKVGEENLSIYNRT